MIFLTTGLMKVPGGALRPGASWGSARIPMTVAVIRRADGRYVLVDCGFSRDEIARPARHFGLVRHLAFRLDHQPETPRCIADQLADHGIDPAEVAAIVPTHLHLDHVGGFSDFPNAEVVVRAEELAGARKGGSWRGFYHIGALDKSGRARAVTLQGDARHGFPGHLDPFGDGRVLLLDARGHTAGSVCVLLTDPDDGRSVLMAGDAAYHFDEIRNGTPSTFARLVNFNREWLLATWGRLRDFEASHPHIPVVLAHDLERFCALQHA